MEKLRSVNTKFWIDPYIETIDSKEKLLFLYLLTNPLANILGIYEISLSRISFDTGLTIEMIEKALKGFEKNLKVFYLEGFIILANFQKNQNMNSNMEKGAIELFKKLPNKVKTLVLEKGLKGFERLSNGFKDFEKYESEGEVESEDEIKDEKAKKHLFKNSPAFDVEYLKTQLYPKYAKYDIQYYYDSAKNYSESKGAMYIDWVAAIRNFILRDEKDGKAKFKTIELKQDFNDPTRKILGQ